MPVASLTPVGRRAGDWKSMGIEREREKRETQTKWVGVKEGERGGERGEIQSNFRERSIVSRLLMIMVIQF
jgi:hypothetical protein